MSADEGPHVPLEVFYVVRTTGDVIGSRHHRICPPLYETPHQAQRELIRLRGAPSVTGTYSVWKTTTYVEPAEWLYNVVLADGCIIRVKTDTEGGAGEPRPFQGNHHESRLDSKRLAALSRPVEGTMGEAG